MPGRTWCSSALPGVNEGRLRVRPQDDELAVIRSRELREAAATLGIAEVLLFDHPTAISDGRTSRSCTRS